LAFGPVLLVVGLTIGFAGDVAAGCGAGEDCARAEGVTPANAITQMNARTIKAEAPGFCRTEDGGLPRMIETKGCFPRL
jgi:hypothetical protein